MGTLRPFYEYYEQDNVAGVQDLFEVTKNTENYRSQKVNDLRNEHSLIMRRIQRILQQKSAYIRISGVLPAEDTPDIIAPVHQNNDFDTGDSVLSQTEDVNKKVLLRRPTDPILNYTRDVMLRNFPEIDVKIRDYDYQLMRLSLLEQKITQWITNILKDETNAQQTTV